MRFEFATAAHIIFGASTFREVGPIAKTMGNRALVVTGRNTARVTSLLALLELQRIHATIFAIAGEPTIEMVCAGVRRAQEEGCDFVIGFGGGSALDGAKAIAALL